MNVSVLKSGKWNAREVANWQVEKLKTVTGSLFLLKAQHNLLFPGFSYHSFHTNYAHMQKVGQSAKIAVPSNTAALFRLTLLISVTWLTVYIAALN